jgi:iron complex transport system substrate-binding protein
MFTRLLLTLAAIVAFGLTTVMAQDAPAGECITDFDANTDYFPEKSEVEFATGFEIEYHNSYKLVTVTRPFLGATPEQGFQYVLIPCGAPTPDGYDDAQVIEIGAQRVVVMSTTILPHFVTLDILDRLMGVDSGFYINTPEIYEMAQQGDLIEVGFGGDVNVEVVLDAETDLVMTYTGGYADFDAHPKLLEAGIPVAINAEYAETGPLARAEWIKFTAAFFDKEAEANAYFSAVAAEYQALQALTADLSDEDKPIALWNSFSSYIDAWAIPGAETYSGILLADAGARIALGDLAPAESVEVSLEVIVDGALDAEVWFPGVFGIAGLPDLLATEPRYADFATFQSGAVWNVDGRTNPNGGVDYFENGVNEPHIILADMIAILHPDLLPDHAPVYFRKLE